ncbi:acyl carrier protein [Streptomyces sp. NBC_00988]|uniref:acyl carrier protein n=1 Tax=Streptomyces sp. NBC_00988 TaxID=2903704 RepID=UPI003869E0B6|nr:acyl carrier protein [Streptomyces sp. NBC_00988]
MSQDTTVRAAGTGDDASSGAIVTDVMVTITGLPPEVCARPTAALANDLGVDSLQLLEIVETLQGRLGIVVADEVTARVRSVADLQDAVARLMAPAS